MLDLCIGEDQAESSVKRMDIWFQDEGGGEGGL